MPLRLDNVVGFAASAWAYNVYRNLCIIQAPAPELHHCSHVLVPDASRTSMDMRYLCKTYQSQKLMCKLDRLQAIKRPYSPLRVHAGADFAVVLKFVYGGTLDGKRSYSVLCSQLH